ncbi:uncharacterized protein Nmag_1595 [Natrialba magadii ATCC 43099]|uniref:Uncharacterized protein n=1 Tax=Natrialba magadii (strain ATCC 43099 / DSM 3394 / CCM 3739 / CIP 104546 / IAM 13178 / JCM 8861 / NBRC 102185 / NCIMB 2190 / MS3) TaxID=547559 RepID=D3SUB3_NATMM|nr:DUF5810 domain-containing protein [Natrialba magadii]ADD05171.1 uncharacterized protein Nmag_1595 [Natrialba magadii ATCC 43099]ELY23209.1 hypothetical protein C500_20506 [Natrialba magadii ATCC 43099]
MGYACPVCAAEQADAEHLANHLAITASLGRQEHQEWLAEHAPEWDECSPPELGEIVAEHAPEIETPSFEGGRSGQHGSGGGHGHGHDHDHTQGRPTGLEADLARQSRQRGRGSMTAETEHVLQEASELTRQMVENAADEDGDSSTSTSTSTSSSSNSSAESATESETNE